MTRQAMSKSCQKGSSPLSASKAELNPALLPSGGLTQSEHKSIYDGTLHRRRLGRVKKKPTRLPDGLSFSDIYASDLLFLRAQRRGTFFGDLHGLFDRRVCGRLAVHG